MRQRQRGAFPAHLEAAIRAAEASSGKPAKARTRSKYGAKKTGGYDSKAEYSYAVELLLRSSKGGDVLTWLEQVPVTIQAEPKVVYRVDFLVFKKDGSWELVEIKGYTTPEWKLKMKLFEANRPNLFKKLVVVKK